MSSSEVFIKAHQIWSAQASVSTEYSRFVCGIRSIGGLIKAIFRRSKASFCSELASRSGGLFLLHKILLKGAATCGKFGTNRRYTLHILKNDLSYVCVAG